MISGVMLAKRADSLQFSSDYVYEPKLDGVRCLAIKNSSLRLFSRNGHDVTTTYPEVVDELHSISGDWILDGEIVAYENGLTSFSQLQYRIQNTPTPQLLQQIPVTFIAFDILKYEKPLTTLPFCKRREYLDNISGLSKTSVSEDGKALYAYACEQKWEGIIAKRKDSTYVTGRSSAWLKYKCEKRQEFLIAGYTAPKGSRDHFGSLLLAYYADATLRYAGKVGTGFSQETLSLIKNKLDALSVVKNPFSESIPHATFVAPYLVGDVRFSEWTKDGKLRHPKFVGLRSDKDPKEVVREDK